MNPIKKFSPEDAAYFERRNRFTEKYSDAGFSFIADNWPMMAGTVNIARSLAIYDLVKRVSDLPGHFCELGCWNGTNLIYLAKLAQLTKPRSYTEVFGFDAFAGLQVFDEKDGGAVQAGRGKYKGNPELLRDALKWHGLEDTVRVVEGNIEQSLPAFLEERKDVRFSFVYLDTDLYPSIRCGIELLYPKLLKGGIMAFDEYNLEDWPGETSAVHDVLGEDVVIHAVPMTRQPTAYIVK